MRPEKDKVRLQINQCLDWSSTVWSFSNFLALILCEINFGSVFRTKIAFNNFEGFEVLFFWKLRINKYQKFPNDQNSKPLKLLKWHVLTF